jgi:hypothetical protein
MVYDRALDDAARYYSEDAVRPRWAEIWSKLRPGKGEVARA